MWRLLTLLLLVCQPVLALDIRITPDASSVKVSTQASIAIDTSSSWTISQIEHAQFQSGYKSLNLGHTDATLWIRLSIQNLLTNPNLIININNPSLDKITVFQKFQGRWKITELGDLREFHQRLLNLPAFAIPITIPKDTSEQIVLRIQSLDALSIPITIFSQNDFSHYLYTHYITFGVLYGIPIGLLFYNLLLFASVRKQTYFLYCLVIISNTFVSLSWDGIIYSLFPDSPYFQQRAISLSMCCGIISLILFVKSFLQTKENVPKVNTYLNFIAFCAVAFSLLIFLPNSSIYYFPIIALAMLMIPGLLAAGINRIKQGYIPAKMYLLAVSSFLIAVILCALSVLNVLPLQEEITYIYKVGVASELILLSLGIAARIKALKLSEQAAIEKVRQIEKEKLKNENLALSKANNLKDTFLSTISHELRTPMNGVKGALALLDTEKNSVHRDELLSTINHSSDTMIKLIERLLLFTELKAGRIKDFPSTFSINKLIKSESGVWLKECHKKSIQFEKYVKFDNEVYADQKHIKWILSELIDNAIKFSNQGKIFISIDLTEGNALVITVCDQGKGITKELNEELTDFFRQEDEDYSREHGGLGLGLSIVSELVKLMAGKLSIRTTENYSTCINIKIPIGSCKSVTKKIAVIKPRKISLPLNVLIIEDNKVNQMVLDKTLLKLGHQTHLADNGTEGYQAAKSYSFDLILMDCQMPNMDGFECTHLIRNSDNLNRHTLIIAITANASDLDKEHCLNSGMDDYRKKPIESNTIKELIEIYFVPS